MSDETVEYECSECKTSVGKYDTVCPKCGASLEEIIKEAVVSKPDPPDQVT